MGKFDFFSVHPPSRAIPMAIYIELHQQTQTHQERAPENEWLDILPHPVFSQDGDSFLLLAGIQETGTEHFTHIKHVTITQQRMSVISHGRYEVGNHAIYLIVTQAVFLLRPNNDSNKRSSKRLKS